MVGLISVLEAAGVTTLPVLIGASYVVLTVDALWLVGLFTVLEAIDGATPLVGVDGSYLVQPGGPTVFGLCCLISILGVTTLLGASYDVLLVDVPYAVWLAG